MLLGTSWRLPSSLNESDAGEAEGPAAKPALFFDRDFSAGPYAPKVPLADIDAIVAQQVVGGDMVEKSSIAQICRNASLELHRAVAQSDLDVTRFAARARRPPRAM